MQLSSVIGILRNGTTDQLSLSLIFGYDVPATFAIVSNSGSPADKDAVVYLSGDITCSFFLTALLIYCLYIYY